MCLPQSSPLLDEVFLCILRAFAQDENKDSRNTRILDLDQLDQLTWSEYVWEWLRLTANPLARHYCTPSTHAEPSPSKLVSGFLDNNVLPARRAIILHSTITAFEIYGIQTGKLWSMCYLLLMRRQI